MTDLHLDSQLLKQLEQLAEQNATNVNDFLAEAVRSYLRQIEQQAMEKNIIAFQAMQPELRRKYQNEYIAIYREQLVDHDKDFQPLHSRIRKQYGSQPVLLRQVTGESDRTWTFRSPRIIRTDP